MTDKPDIRMQLSPLEDISMNYTWWRDGRVTYHRTGEFAQHEVLETGVFNCNKATLVRISQEHSGFTKGRVDYRNRPT